MSENVSEIPEQMPIGWMPPGIRPEHEWPWHNTLDEKQSEYYARWRRMELESVNKLYLELSQVVTAQTAREKQLLDALKDACSKLGSAHEIANRNGEDTNWPAFRNQVAISLTTLRLILYPPKTVFAWIIEHEDSEGSAPRYFTGKSTPALRWSDPGNHADACRFSRRSDAERVCLGFYPPRNHRVAEHGWDE